MVKKMALVVAGADRYRQCIYTSIYTRIKNINDDVTATSFSVSKRHITCVL